MELRTLKLKVNGSSFLGNGQQWRLWQVKWQCDVKFVQDRTQSVEFQFFSEGLNRGTTITCIKHFTVWLCSKKQLNFTHFNTNSKKFSKTVSFFQKEANGSKKANIFLFSQKLIRG